MNQGQNSDMGEWSIKQGPKIPTSFMDGPLLIHNLIEREIEREKLQMKPHCVKLSHQLIKKSENSEEF